MFVKVSSLSNVGIINRPSCEIIMHMLNFQARQASPPNISCQQHCLIFHFCHKRDDFVK